jgi:hypothetical protein
MLAVSPLCYKYLTHRLMFKCQCPAVKLLGQYTRLCQVCSLENIFLILVSERLENIVVVGEG